MPWWREQQQHQVVVVVEVVVTRLRGQAPTCTTWTVA
jgi:hypothetical protein